MSCSTNQRAATKSATAAGLSSLASKNSYTVGSSTPSPTSASIAGRPKKKRKQSAHNTKRQAKKKMVKAKSNTTDSKKKTSEARPKAADGKKKAADRGVKPEKDSVKPEKGSVKPEKGTIRPASEVKSKKVATKTKQTPFFALASVKRTKPIDRKVTVADKFTSDELSALFVQFHYGAAAVNRAIKENQQRVELGIGHSDPRPMDWARQDQKHFHFLIDQLSAVRTKGQKQLDLSSLADNDVVDLYEFNQFEAERHHRNIDHLTGKLSHLNGSSAEYMTRRHTLQANFHSYLADQIEPFITVDMLAKALGREARGR